jgi:hypothetical protein
MGGRKKILICIKAGRLQGEASITADGSSVAADILLMTRLCRVMVVGS